MRKPVLDVSATEARLFINDAFRQFAYDLSSNRGPETTLRPSEGQARFSGFPIIFFCSAKTLAIRDNGPSCLQVFNKNIKGIDLVFTSRSKEPKRAVERIALPGTVIQKFRLAALSAALDA